MKGVDTSKSSHPGHLNQLIQIRISCPFYSNWMLQYLFKELGNIKHESVKIDGCVYFIICESHFSKVAFGRYVIVISSLSMWEL